MHAWEQIQQTVDYIEAHLGEDIHIDQLARMAALSPFYYQRLFSRLVRKPVAEYIRLRRLARAAELLPDSEQRILDIALELGFRSHEHFTRAFREAFGLTPAAYRRRPVALNRMNKPDLLLHYVLIDEGVPLIADGIVLEITRRGLAEPLPFVGLEQTLPFEALSGLGTESGIDPLDALWRDFHRQKGPAFGLPDSAEEIGVLHGSAEPGQCTYFAGARLGAARPGVGTGWTLPAGEYVVVAFEAERFESLVMDALYKAQQYVYGVWLPRHGLLTAPFSAERYASHSPETTGMELWLQLISQTYQ